MRIVHIAACLSGGAGTGMLRYHQALLAAGTDSRIILGYGDTGRNPHLSICARKASGLVHRLVWRAGIWLDASDRIAAEVERLGKKGNYELFSPPFSRCTPEDHPWIREADVVNLHWVSGIVDWPRFFRKVTKPIVITLHDQQPYLGGFHYSRDVENNPELRHTEARLRTIKQAALRGHRLTVVGNSEWNTLEAKKSGFFPPDTRFHTIYYPLDTTAYARRPKAMARAALGLPEDKIVIGFASEDLGNARKGFDVLLNALRLLPPGLAAQCSLLSFGREPAREVKERVPIPWVHLGHLESDAVKAAAYSAMDLFVVPSLAEAFGQTAIEALACGTATVASRVGGLTEALFGGQGGVLVEPGSPEALATALASLVDHPERRHQLPTTGRKLLAERHACNHIAGQLREAYAAALDACQDSPVFGLK